MRNNATPVQQPSTIMQGQGRKQRHQTRRERHLRWRKRIRAHTLPPGKQDIRRPNPRTYNSSQACANPPAHTAVSGESTRPTRAGCGYGPAVAEAARRRPRLGIKCLHRLLADRARLARRIRHRFARGHPPVSLGRAEVHVVRLQQPLRVGWMQTRDVANPWFPAATSRTKSSRSAGLGDG